MSDLKKAALKLAQTNPEFRQALKAELSRTANINKQAGYNLVNEMHKAMVTFMKHFANDLQQAGYDVTVNQLTATVKTAPGAAVVFELDPHNLPVGIRYRGVGRIRIKAGEIAAYESSASADRALKVLNSVAG